MKSATAPQVKHEIQLIDTLVAHLDALHSQAKHLRDDNLRESITISIDALIESLRDERTKLQLQLDDPLGF